MAPLGDQSGLWVGSWPQSFPGACLIHRDTGDAPAPLALTGATPVKTQRRQDWETCSGALVHPLIDLNSAFCLLAERKALFFLEDVSAVTE